MLNKLFFIFIFIFSAVAFSSQCLLNEALKNPELSANAKFWEELSALNAKGKPSDEQIKTLITKYDANFQAAPSADSASGTFQKAARLDIQNRASKEIKGLPANLKAKVEEFAEIAIKPNGMHELHSNPGRWHLEHLKQEGPNSYSVRLNDGYRVLFDYKDDVIQIRRVNKGQIHGN